MLIVSFRASSNEQEAAAALNKLRSAQEQELVGLKERLDEAKAEAVRVNEELVRAKEEAVVCFLPLVLLKYPLEL